MRDALKGIIFSLFFFLAPMLAMVLHTFRQYSFTLGAVYSLLVLFYVYTYLGIHLFFVTYKEELSLLFPISVFLSIVCLSVVSSMAYNPLILVLLAGILALHSMFSLFLYRFVVFRDGMMICCVHATAVDEETIHPRTDGVVPEVSYI